MATRGVRRTRSQELVSHSFVQLQAKVPPRVREEWQRAAADNKLSLSRFFESFVDEADARGQSLGDFLGEVLRQKSEPVVKTRRARS